MFIEANSSGVSVIRRFIYGLLAVASTLRVLVALAARCLGGV